MKRPLFYRNVDARDHLELFLVSAITSLLLLRLFLYLSGYPQLGGGGLHIAHMLYGGLLMMAAIIINVSFLGRRIVRLAALLGGVGFGIFIDELGKFISQDNNYFFRPTVGIIYAIFISLYLLFNFLSRTAKLTSQEYQLNALSQFEEAVHQDLDPHEKRQIKLLLNKADQSNIITIELQDLLKRIDTVPSPVPHLLQRLLEYLDKRYQQFWQKRNSSQAVAFVFIAQSGLFLLLVLGSVVHSVDSVQNFFQGNTSYGELLIFGQLLSSVVAAVFAIIGVTKLRSSRVEAFEAFRKATLVNVFLTEFFIFSRIQFGAFTGFIVNILLLGALRYAIYQETHHHQRRKNTAI